MYEKGKGVKEDAELAVRQYWLAAENGLKQAQATLGQIYELGEIVKPDYGEAEKWYRRAIEQGDTRCATRLGAMLFHDPSGFAGGRQIVELGCGPRRSLRAIQSCGNVQGRCGG
jgi:TPR repeat protein